MKITHWESLPIAETPHKVDVRKLYETDDAQVMHICLKPGESLKPHITPVDVFFFILEGNPTIQVGDEKREVEPNSLIESPKEIVHCISNLSQCQARILVVKTPKPIKSARIL
ncbi:MAG: cupin domain-containing protein [Bacteroidales bacterium]|nr:cupin domain-containing protein [Bacteroidales bacterium]